MNQVLEEQERTAQSLAVEVQARYVLAEATAVSRAKYEAQEETKRRMEGEAEVLRIQLKVQQSSHEEKVASAKELATQREQQHIKNASELLRK